jgi:hypothetical protein
MYSTNLLDRNKGYPLNSTHHKNWQARRIVGYKMSAAMELIGYPLSEYSILVARRLSHV